MKKLFISFTAVCIISLTAACGTDSQNNAQPQEQEIKGEYFNTGRVEVFVPEGWQAMEKTARSDGFTAMIVKGDPQDFLSLPYLSVLYGLPSEPIVSAAAFYEDVIQREDFDLGEYHWKNWTGTYGGRRADVAEAEGDFGFLSVNLNNGDEEGEIISYEDPDIQAVLKSIRVMPTADYDWVILEDGNARITLKNYEGRIWEDAAEMYTDEVEGSCSLAGNTVNVTMYAGTGTYYVYVQLDSEDQTENWGEAAVSFEVKDGRITGVYEAVVEIRETPESLDPQEREDTTDYDAIDAYLTGAWVNPANGLSMFIQKNGEAEHAYTFTIRSTDHVWVIPVNVEKGGSISYDSAQTDFEDPLEVKGTFLIDGNMLIWSRDEKIGEFDNATIFTKVQ